MKGYRFRRPGWELPERSVTPENAHLGRRDFLRRLAAGGMGTAAVLAGWRPLLALTPGPDARLTGARGDHRFGPEQPLTAESLATRHTNFFEFTPRKDQVADRAAALQVKPWRIQVDGLVRKPLVLELDDLRRRMRLEERVYRHRCVEAWAMVIPWLGFPLSALLALAEPMPQARFVRFVSVEVPRELQSVPSSILPRPYCEGLTVQEATHELTLLAVGMYGKDLTKQNGAPVRLVVPWKYGYKGAKSVVRIELVEARPTTFWQQLLPSDYLFEANVDPARSSPLWPQATEVLLGSGERRPTRLYNGYGDWVGRLYGPGG